MPKLHPVPASAVETPQLLAALGWKGDYSQVRSLSDLVSESAGRSTLSYALELHRRIGTEAIERKALLNDPSLVKNYLRTCRPGGDSQETTGILLLNCRNRLIRDIPNIYRGTLNHAVVEPREILRQALLLKAAAIIVYHNHPSGDATPSREDLEFTRRLGAAADAIGVRFLDHVVIGIEGCVSFRESGLM